MILFESNRPSLDGSIENTSYQKSISSELDDFIDSRFTRGKVAIWILQGG